MSLLRLGFVGLALMLVGCADRVAANDACSVYRSFYMQLPNNDRLGLAAFADPQRSEGAAPTTFERGMWRDPERSPEYIELDTSPYFEGVGAEQNISIPECFTTYAPYSPRFVESTEDVLSLVEGRQAELSAVWHLSPVAFSPDGQHALMVAGFSCGGLCGGGAYYLFQRVEDGWLVVGRRELWVV